MINYLKGIISEISENSVVIDVNGVGYELSASAQTLREIEKTGIEATLFVHMSLREDGVTLFGFATRREKAMFLRLITISGIGPKMAVSILSGLSADSLAAAITSGDYLRLSSIKGIGKKTAERLVLELKDKVSAEYGTAGGGDSGSSVPSNHDAVLALISMGYSRQEAQAAVATVKNADSLSVEEIIINSLKGGR